MLDDSRIRTDAIYWDQLQRVVVLLRSLHVVPENWRPVPLVPVRQMKQQGSYFFSSGPAPYALIEFSDSGSDQAISILHEVGHLLDHQFIGNPGIWATDHPVHHALIEWERATIRSDCWSLLHAIRHHPSPPLKYGDVDEGDRRHLDYLLSARELFARSYLQWAISRSDDLVLRSRLLNLPKPSGQSDEFPEQWDDEDFQVIEVALSDLFAALNEVRR